MKRYYKLSNSSYCKSFIVYAKEADVRKVSTLIKQQNDSKDIMPCVSIIDKIEDEETGWLFIIFVDSKHVVFVVFADDGTLELLRNLFEKVASPSVCYSPEELKKKRKNIASIDEVIDKIICGNNE